MDTDDSLSTAVVVGDDRGAVLKEVSATLEKAGFVVVTAPNGRAALDLCREQRRPVDLAVNERQNHQRDGRQQAFARGEVDTL
jgi:CheY-like chemotaxis protein